MITFLSSWVKGLGLAIVIVSILEMLLPNNKTKKYIRMVMGIYVLYTMISPFVSNKEWFNEIKNMNWEENIIAQTSTQVNQTSMDARIKQLYQEELEKDITKKLKEQGYEVTNCQVKLKIEENEEDTEISKIKIKVEKKQEKETKEDNNIEEQIVTEIQKIKPIDTSIQKEVNETNQEGTNKKVSKVDIQNIKKFLMEEYEVKEKCLEIN